jgi:hypothetical protein
MQIRGSMELLFKNLLYDVHKEKVWRIVTKIVDFSDGIQHELIQCSPQKKFQSGTKIVGFSQRM